MLLFSFDGAMAAYAGALPQNHLTHGTPLLKWLYRGQPRELIFF